MNKTQTYTLHWEMTDATIDDEGFSPVTNKAQAIKLAKYCASTATLDDISAILVLDATGRVVHTAPTGRALNDGGQPARTSRARCTG